MTLSSCISPTLPVPPPAQPDVTAPDASGLVTVKGQAGSAQPNAEVTVWNQALDEGRGEGRTTVARPDGSWTESIPATSKQTLWIWQTVGMDRSSHVEVRVP